MSILFKRNLDFSVIIPTFNRDKYVRLAIASALRQKNITLEIIVSDDASTDRTEKIVKSFKDVRIRYFRNNKRLGTSMNFRRCFLESRGDYIFTLGDDDLILLPNTLFEMKKFMNKNSLGMGKIGCIGYNSTIMKPYQLVSLGTKPLVVKPHRSKNILAESINFGLGYFSGLTYNNLFLDKTKLNLDHDCYPDHMCPIERVVAYDLINRKGIGYIPNFFIVSHLSLQLIPKYFTITRNGNFFIESPIDIAKPFMNSDQHIEFRSHYLKSQTVLLPNVKYFTNYKNYCMVLKRIVNLDSSIAFNLRFIIFSSIGLLPNIAISMLRSVALIVLKRRVAVTLKNCHYTQEMRALLADTNILSTKELS